MTPVFFVPLLQKRKRMVLARETAKRTAYLKQRNGNTARSMTASAAVSAVVADLRPPEAEKFDAESLLPRKIKNESVVDM